MSISKKFSDIFEYKNGELFSKKNGKKVGYTEKDGYLRTNVGGKKYYVHVIIFIMLTGREPTGVIDHLNGVRSDCRIENLKEKTIRMNSCNRECHRKGKLAGVKKRKGKFISRIKINGKEKYLGTFETEIEAHNCYMNNLKEISVNFDTKMKILNARRLLLDGHCDNIECDYCFGKQSGCMMMNDGLCPTSHNGGLTKQNKAFLVEEISKYGI